MLAGSLVFRYQHLIYDNVSFHDCTLKWLIAAYFQNKFAIQFEFVKLVCQVCYFVGLNSNSSSFLSVVDVLVQTQIIISMVGPRYHIGIDG